MQALALLALWLLTAQASAPPQEREPVTAAQL